MKSLAFLLLTAIASLAQAKIEFLCYTANDWGFVTAEKYYGTYSNLWGQVDSKGGFVTLNAFPITLDGGDPKVVLVSAPRDGVMTGSHSRADFSIGLSLPNGFEDLQEGEKFSADLSYQNTNGGGSSNLKCKVKASGDVPKRDGYDQYHRCHDPDERRSENCKI